jgi:hypothetical protein
MPTDAEADTFMNLAREVFALGFPFRIHRGPTLLIQVDCANAACFEATLAFARERNMEVQGSEKGLLLVPPPNSQPAPDFP